MSSVQSNIPQIMSEDKITRRRLGRFPLSKREQTTEGEIKYSQFEVRFSGIDAFISKVCGRDSTTLTWTKDYEQEALNVREMLAREISDSTENKVDGYKFLDNEVSKMRFMVDEDRESLLVTFYHLNSKNEMLFRMMVTIDMDHKNNIIMDGLNSLVTVALKFCTEVHQLFTSGSQDLGIKKMLPAKRCDFNGVPELLVMLDAVMNNNKSIGFRYMCEEGLVRDYILRAITVRGKDLDNMKKQAVSGEDRGYTKVSPTRFERKYKVEDITSNEILNEYARYFKVNLLDEIGIPVTLRNNVFIQVFRKFEPRPVNDRYEPEF